MGKKLKKDTGITLIALIVTIVVLIILAVISINILIGEGGIIQSANKAKDRQGRAEALDAATIAYATALIDKKGLGNKTDTIEDLTVAELIKQGYDVRVVNTTASNVTGINLSETNLDITVGDEAKIVNITYEGSNTSKTSYYLLLNGAYYELKMENAKITLAEEATDVDGLENITGPRTEVISSDTNEEIIKVVHVGNTIEITPIGTGNAFIAVQNGDISKYIDIYVSNTIPANVKIHIEYSRTLYDLDFSEVDLRYICQVYDANKEPLEIRSVDFSDDIGIETTYEVPMYHDSYIVVFADAVNQTEDSDTIYNTDDLKMITINAEKYSSDPSQSPAFLGVYHLENANSDEEIQIELREITSSIKIGLSESFMDYLQKEQTSETLENYTSEVEFFSAIKGVYNSFENRAEEELNVEKLINSFKIERDQFYNERNRVYSNKYYSIFMEPRLWNNAEIKFIIM